MECIQQLVARDTHTIQATTPSGLSTPQAGVHINTQEGLWHHVKRQITGCKNIEDVLINIMFKRRFNASSGLTQIANTVNGYITVLMIVKIYSATLL